MPPEKNDRPLRIDSLLKNIYENVRHPAAFSSAYKLYLAAKKKEPRITKKQVLDWLQRNKAYTLHRRVTSRFPRRPILVCGPFDQYQADLIDYQPLSYRNGGNKYLLTVIDCFSRYAVIVPVRRKTSQDVLASLKKAFQFMRIPRKMQTDEGKEFYNKEVGEYFKQHKINHFSTHTGLKAQMCERFNRTVRDKLLKYMTSRNTTRYIDAIPDLIHSYNSTPHSSLGKFFAPKDVNEENRRDVFEILYGDYLRKKNKIHKVQIGDKVRISKFRTAFTRKYVPNFSHELYVIAERLKTQPPMYKVFDPRKKEILSRSFYENEVQLFIPAEDG